ncbi:uncharacterized protein [Nicotiana sylvestris]|uniref:uncharacterized protein n=1 Tax=Nicotiana sylvestris TaxID=4096 RepID=UPI00388C6333
MDRTSRTVPQQNEVASSSWSSKEKAKVIPTLGQSLSENMLMKPPSRGVTEVSEPAEGNKRKGKKAVDPSVAKRPKPHRPKTAIGTSAYASEASLGTDDENGDKSRYHLEERPKKDAKAPQVPRLEAAESGTVESGRPIDRREAKCKEMYDHALFRLNEELSCREKELEKLSSRLRESEAHSVQKEKESGELRATLEGALREKAALVEQVEQNRSQIGQNDAVILELVSTHDLLKDARKEIAELAAAKSKIERNVATYLKDIATVHQTDRDASTKAKQKLTRAIKQARAEARRKTLEEIEAGGIDLLVGNEEARELERKLALLIVPNEDPGDGWGGQW